MNRLMVLGMTVLTLLSVGGACAATVSADEFERLRQKAVNRPRTILWDDDGCDMTFYPLSRKDLIGKPISQENFDALFLDAVKGTKVDTITYSTVFGFGYFTASRAGQFNTNNMNHTGPGNTLLNVSKQFVEKFGKDALDLATEFARRNKKEIFLSLRFNDNHDAGSSWENRNNLFSPFKAENPECMVGVKPASLGKTSGWADADFGGTACCGWAAADFAQEKVRDFCRSYVREFCENYDLDGILFDFFRHPQLFRRVAWGGHASEDELRTMTDLMADLRSIADEVGKRRGRPFVLAMRVPDSVGYCRAIGIDLDAWMSRKVVDFVVCGGYFQLEPWSRSAELAHRYGLKCYASLDETRIRPIKGMQPLPGRQEAACYCARAAVATAEGMDGVFYFNFEYYKHDLQREVLKLDPRDLDGVDKLYFPTYTGADGYKPTHFLADGEAFRKLNGLNPEYPVKLADGGCYEFDLPFGDDFSVWRARGKEPQVLVSLRADVKEISDIAEFSVNGSPVTFTKVEKGVLTAEVPADALRKGLNKFSFRAGAAVTLHDLSMSVSARKRTLVAYFSHTGNTRLAAETVAKALGADLEEIVPVRPYPSDVKECCRVAQPECDARTTPAIRPIPANLDRYDQIVVCSPNWFQTIAPPVRTFLQENRLSGKRMRLLLTHGSGAGKEKCVDEFAKLVCDKGATVGTAKVIAGKSVSHEVPALREFARQWN